MNIEVGKYYRTRGGDKVGPLWLDDTRSGWSRYKWMGAGDIEGRYSDTGQDGDGKGYMPPTDLIAEWTACDQSPVREVTTVRKEIVPGVYGRVCVSTADNNQVALKLTHQIGEYAMLDLSEMDALLTTMTAIRDTMADSSGDVSPPQAR